MAADPDDRDHQPVRERPPIQLDAKALYSLKNVLEQLVWHSPSWGRSSCHVRCCVLTRGAWGTTGCVELLPQAYDQPALRREGRTAYMRRCERVSRHLSECINGFSSELLLAPPLLCANLHLCASVENEERERARRTGGSLRLSRCACCMWTVVYLVCAARIESLE